MTASGSWRYPKTPLWVLAYRVPRVWLEEKAPPEFPGPAVHPFHHPGHRGGGDGPGLELHQHGGVHVIDAVAQGAEEAGLRVGKGQGADARHGVTQPDSQLIRTLLILHRLYGELGRFSFPLDLEGQRLSLLLGHQGLDALNGVDLLAVDVGNHIACPQTAFPPRGEGAVCGLHIGQASDHHSVRKELDSHRPAQRDNCIADLHRACTGGASQAGAARARSPDRVSTSSRQAAAVQIPPPSRRCPGVSFVFSCKISPPCQFCAATLPP